uniref:Uncharacterized protein n=1 Tax=Anguilla anguilla TaxID=7936 RepID=A0A0E9WEX2_ANGAN
MLFLSCLRGGKKLIMLKSSIYKYTKFGFFLNYLSFICMSETGVRQRSPWQLSPWLLLLPGRFFSVSGFIGFALEVHKPVSPRLTLQELVKRQLNWPIPASQDIQWL